MKQTYPPKEKDQPYGRWRRKQNESEPGQGVGEAPGRQPTSRIEKRQVRMPCTWRAGVMMLVNSVQQQTGTGLSELTWRNLPLDMWRMITASTICYYFYPKLASLGKARVMCL